MSFETVTIGGATLIRGDCMEVLPTLGRFDAVVADDTKSYIDCIISESTKRIQI